MLAVVRARRLELDVLDDGRRVFLDEFLQRRLVVLDELAALHAVEFRRELAHGVVPRDVPSLVEVDGAEHGFERVFEVRRARATAAHLLAMPQEQVVAEPEPRRDLRKRGRADDARARARELALWELREMRIKISAGGKLQHSISEKLEAFVVRDAPLRFIRVGRMDEGRVQEADVVERHAEPLCERKKFLLSFFRQSIHM